MFRVLILLLVAVAAISICRDGVAQDKAKPNAPQIVATDAAHAGPDFERQGEYSGSLKIGEKEVSYGVQVVAMGNGGFHEVAYFGGLPGSGWNGTDRFEADGATKAGTTTFWCSFADIFGKSNDGRMIYQEKKCWMTMRAGVMSLKDKKTPGTLKKVNRESPTLGAKPPAGAIVLFDGTSTDAFVDGRIKDGLLLEGATSKQKFQSYKIHLEFMLPFMPEARGQGRGNSGYYSQGRYETQILDSFGLVPQKDDCGAIYGIEPPRINMCYPPLSWQTYDVDCTAAEYKGGKKVKNARITVLHNGVEVQKETEATHATTAAPIREGPEPGPIYLQNHGNPVRFRNIWVLEKE